MPTMFQLAEPVRGNAKSEEVRYLIRDADTLNEALVHLLTNAPAVVDGKVLSNNDSSVEETVASSGEWIGIAKYAAANSSLNAQAQDTFSISFDISGSQQKITQSRATVGPPDPSNPGQTLAGWKSANAPFLYDFMGAIGVNGEGKDATVDGCDIVVPVMNYEFQCIFPSNQFEDGTYIRKLLATVGKVNADVFQGLQPGEALLTKVTGSRRAGDRRWVLKFGVAVSENEEDLSIPEDAPQSPLPLDPDAIYGITKRGWDYLWVRYQAVTRTDAASNLRYVTRVARAAYVEQVYKYTNYSNLGLDAAEEA